MELELTLAADVSTKGEISLIPTSIVWRLLRATPIMHTDCRKEKEALPVRSDRVNPYMV